MKRLKKIALYFLLPTLVLFSIFRIATGNRRTLQLSTCDGSDAATMRRLNELVERDFLHPDVFSVFTRSDFGPCCYVYYNAQHGALWIEEDPGSGWSGRFDLPRERLKVIAEKGFSFNQMRDLLPQLPKYKEALTYP